MFGRWGLCVGTVIRQQLIQWWQKKLILSLVHADTIKKQPLHFVVAALGKLRIYNLNDFSLPLFANFTIFSPFVMLINHIGNAALFDLLPKFLSLETISESVSIDLETLLGSSSPEHVDQCKNCSAQSFIIIWGDCCSRWQEWLAWTYCPLLRIHSNGGNNKNGSRHSGHRKERNRRKVSSHGKISHVKAFAKIERSLDHKSCCDRCLHIYQSSSERYEGTCIPFFSITVILLSNTIGNSA